MILPWKRSDSSKDSPFVPSPDKARPFLERATKARDQSSYEAALFYFANAMKFDPLSVVLYDQMYECAKEFHAAAGRPATSADTRPLDGPGSVDKLAIAVLHWMRDANNLERALDMLQASVNAQQLGFGTWAAPKVFNLLCVVHRDKPNKKALLRAKSLFMEVAAWEEAKLCVETALKLDPSDMQLDREFKQILANRAIEAAGFHKEGGATGNFQGNVKDLAGQRALSETEAITGSAGTEDRNLARTKADYDANSSIPENVNKYCLALRRMGMPEHEATAYRVYLKGYEELKEYRFRMAAGDIKMMRAARELAKVEDAATAAPGDATAAEALVRIRRAVLDLQAAEYKERSQNYPTDRTIKAELGRILYELGQYEDAMGCLQLAKEEPRMKVPAAHMLGRCFAVSGWHAEAVGEYKEALAAMDITQQDREQDLKYDLMLSLIEIAKDEKSAQYARDAAEICSTILRKDISYRDIRQRRKELDALVKELS
ncbi:MAG: hypothetical protein EXS03_08780 [Phycisphaerales bacterium]|nr:hypothetical protein [Phycisphaerales bacterium]